LIYLEVDQQVRCIEEIEMTTTNGSRPRTTWDTGEAVITPASRAPAPASKPAAARGWILGLIAAASLILGIALAVHGDRIDQSGSNGAGWMAWGVILILAPVLTGAVAVAVWIIREASAETRQYRAWKRTLTPQQRLGVNAAETAALYAAWAGVHHLVKEGRERSAANYQARGAASQDRVSRFYGQS
jgi:hypothetical protein